MEFSTQIYVNWEKDVHFELRDVNGNPADNLKQHGGLSYTPMRAQWANVPADGLMRLRANGNMATTSLATKREKPGGLSLFCPGGGWVIPADDTNAYFLSATLLSQPAISSPGSNAVWRGKLELPAVKLSAVKH